MGFPLETVQALPVCDQCANARCAPNALVPPDSAGLLADCDATSKCVPEDYAVVGGAFKAKACRSLNDAEGRCISLCVPQVASQADQLPQADCAASEKCAPCYNPIDGVDTGACSVACDTGPSEEPIVFTPCGMGRGVCVPPDLVPANLKAIVPIETCTGGDVCAPKEKANDLTYKFPSCVAQLDGFDPLPAACVPAYLLADRGLEAIFLQQKTCATGELCAPCTSPLDQTNTGACD
jgi:hypothetical protein